MTLPDLKLKLIRMCEKQKTAKYQLTSRRIEWVKRPKVLRTDEILAAAAGNRASNTLNGSGVVAIAAGDTKPAGSVQCLIIVTDRVDGEKPTIDVQLRFRDRNFLFIYNPSH